MPAHLSPTKYSLSHVGLYVADLEMMVDFYTQTLGFLVTDRGPAKGAQVVFLSRNPSDHHQLALVSGRKAALEDHLVQQVSFRVDSLEVLTELYPVVASAKVTDIQPVFHGVSFSLYFRDPEGNRLELFTDTDWYVAQPFIEPLDLTRPVKEICEEARDLAKRQPSFRPIEAWEADFEKRIGAFS